MIYTVIATGSSALNFTPRGHVIGCNDASRFGKLDSLVVCNRPQQFSKERYEIIKNTQCENFYSHKQGWSKEFPSWTRISLVTWYGHYRKGQIYSSNSSPIIAITLAVKLGAKDIIMWGCDFKDHHIFNDSNPQTQKEITVYRELFDGLMQADIRLWLGSNYGALSEYIPTYEL